MYIQRIFGVSYNASRLDIMSSPVENQITIKNVLLGKKLHVAVSWRNRGRGGRQGGGGISHRKNSSCSQQIKKKKQVIVPKPKVTDLALLSLLTYMVDGSFGDKHINLQKGPGLDFSLAGTLF
jgi:hypothetical protein